MSPTPLEKPIFAHSSPGHRGVDLPAAGVPRSDVTEILPGVRLRTDPPLLPCVAESQVVRHYTRLAHLNHCVDTGFYPLGSCTMKYNPKMDDEVAALPGFAELHPYQPEEDLQGILTLLYRLEQGLLAITGMRRATLQPAAGAHGELTGILMIKAYHRDHSGRGADTRSSSPIRLTAQISRRPPWLDTKSSRSPAPLGVS